MGPNRDVPRGAQMCKMLVCVCARPVMCTAVAPQLQRWGRREVAALLGIAWPEKG